MKINSFLFALITTIFSTISFAQSADSITSNQPKDIATMEIYNTLSIKCILYFFNGKEEDLNTKLYLDWTGNSDANYHRSVMKAIRYVESLGYSLKSSSSRGTRGDLIFIFEK